MRGISVAAGKCNYDITGVFGKCVFRYISKS